MAQTTYLLKAFFSSHQSSNQYGLGHVAVSRVVFLYDCLIYKACFPPSPLDAHMIGRGCSTHLRMLADAPTYLCPVRHILGDQLKVESWLYCPTWLVQGWGSFPYNLAVSTHLNRRPRRAKQRGLKPFIKSWVGWEVPGCGMGLAQNIIHTHIHTLSPYPVSYPTFSGNNV